MAAVTMCSDFGVQENKVSPCFPSFPIYLPWNAGTGCHDLCFWMLTFKPAFSLSSFTFIKRLFSSSLLSPIRVVSFVYLMLLKLLPAILIPACSSGSPAFHMMCFAYKLNKQGDNIQLWCTHFIDITYSQLSCVTNFWNYWVQIIFCLLCTIIL